MYEESMKTTFKKQKFHIFLTFLSCTTASGDLKKQTATIGFCKPPAYRQSVLKIKTPEPYAPALPTALLSRIMPSFQPHQKEPENDKEPHHECSVEMRQDRHTRETEEKLKIHTELVIREGYQTG